MDIKQKDEVEINDSNLKDFLEQDLESIEFIINESKEFTSDLKPLLINSKEKKRIREFMIEYLKNKKYFSLKIIKVAYLNKYYREYNNYEIIEIKEMIQPYFLSIFSILGRRKLLVRYSKLIYIVNKKLIKFLNDKDL